MLLESLITDKFLVQLESESGQSALGGLAGPSGARIRKFHGGPCTWGLRAYLVRDVETTGWRVVVPGREAWTGLEFIAHCRGLDNAVAAVTYYIQTELAGDMQRTKSVTDLLGAYAPWAAHRQLVRLCIERGLQLVEAADVRRNLGELNLWDFRNYYKRSGAQQNRNIIGMDWRLMQALGQCGKAVKDSGFKPDGAFGFVLHRTPGVPSAVIARDFEGRGYRVSFDQDARGKFLPVAGCLGLESLLDGQPVVGLSDRMLWARMQLSWQNDNCGQFPFVWASDAPLLADYAAQLRWAAQHDKDIENAQRTPGSGVFGPMIGRNPREYELAAKGAMLPRTFMAL